MNKNDAQTPSSGDNALTVGLGASAGGLQALKAFFKSLPENPGIAFIVIVHLSPDHESSLAELLQAETSLKVEQVKEWVEMEEDHIYVIPPKKLLEVGDGHLEVSEPENGHHLASIDFLFRSLGEVKGRNAAGVIMSGAGSDGTMGIKTVKERGGLTIVQEPKEAQYTDMPWSAIDSGVADFVLPVQDIAQELLNYKKSLSDNSIPEVKDGEEKTLHKILTRVRSKTGHDFSNYKRSSVLRRIERRMHVSRVNGMAEYLTHLQEHPDEATNLFKDLLISVTNFFRDADAFNTLNNTIIPKLFADKKPTDQVQVWVPGCATGEEAYSFAILLCEHANGLDAPPGIQIFASDIDEAALNVARQGRYPDSIAADISSDRLERFFKPRGAQYQVSEEIQKIILFAPHNLLSDPPFSKLDLVACRNLLIYLNRDLQSEVFNLFHYAIKPEGYLFLGLSDSNLEASELFKPLNKNLRIYRRTPTSKSHLRIPQSHLQKVGNKPRIPYFNQRQSPDRIDYEALHRNLLARLYAPESAIINENYKVIHATENIGKYLEYAGGEPSHDILQMIKPELRQALQSLLFSIDKNPAKHLHKKTRLNTDEGWQQVEVIVHRISDNSVSEGLLHVIFKEFGAPVEDPEGEKPGIGGDSDESNKLIDALQQELTDTKEQLQITIEEYETSNEELQSMNEELQSTTEELVTSKEELQSVNEELTTVNQELENKVEKLDHANNDLKNLMEATEIGIVFVDRKLCVQRFTSHATRIFNLIDSDKGRPLEHVTHQLDYDSLQDDVKQVLSDLKHIKKAKCSQDEKNWYIIRLRPYRTTGGGVEGVVLTLVDITQLKEAEKSLENKARQEEALATLGLYALDDKKVDEVVHRAMQMICEILTMDFCLLYEFDYETNNFRLMETMGPGFEGGFPEDDVAKNNTEWDVAYTMQKKEIVKVENYDRESRFGLLPVLENYGIKSGVNVIVEGTRNDYGVLSAYSKDERAFSEHDINFLRVVANLAGESIDRRRASRELKDVNEQLMEEVLRSKQYQREILNSSVVERWELGGFLHDNLAQKLVAIKMLLSEIEFNAENPDDIPLLHRIIDEGIQNIRDLTHDIIPIDIEEEGVAHAFRFLMQQTQKLHRINCRLQTDEVIDDITNRTLATNLYHVVQEAVKNAAMHGEAENITASITKPNGDLVLRIEDDGIGLKHTSKEKNGKGLRIMKHRMDLMGGSFKIENKPESGNGSGTIVTCVIPYETLTGNGSGPEE